MMNIKSILSLIFIVFLSAHSFSQSNPFSQNTPVSAEGYKLCNTSELAYQLYENDPAIRQSFNAPRTPLAQRSSLPFSDSVVRIPVNFIVVHNNGPENISDVQIESQIRILNESYRKIQGTPGNGNGVDTKIEFFLAKKDPAGNCIDGIERHQSTLTQHSTGNPQLANTFPPIDVNKYLNVYVVSSIGTGGTIGYTYLPSANNGTPPQNVIYIAHHAIGDVGTAGTVFPAISSGTVLAHEIGHWLDLLHVFEPQGSCPSGNCANTGDRCCDTPPQQSASPNGCNPANSCGTPNSINNYMDYGSDNCFNEFTADQKTRMDFAVSTLRPALFDSMNAIDAGYYGCLGINYCQSEATNTSGTEIRNVTIQSINNNSSNECTGYSSFNTTFTDLTQDSTYQLSVTTGHCSNGTAPNHEVRAYFDWNRDADFDDPGEEVFVKANGPAGTASVNITVPGNAPLDRTGMRIVASDGGVIGPCGTYSNGETEDYGLQIIAPPPTITSFTPTSGPVSQPVFIVGDNFLNASSVTFNNTTTIFHTVLSNDSIRVNVPANATTGPITVTTPTGSDISAGNFTVTTQLPAITNFSPDSGFVGDPVTIFGSNLGTIQQVYFNGVPVNNFNQVSAIQVNTTVPPSAATGKIQLQNSAGTATSANDFFVRVPATTASISGTTQICEGESADITFNMNGTPPYDLEFSDGTNTYTRNNVTSPYIESVSPGVGTTTYTILSVSDTNVLVTAPDPNISGSADITVVSNPVSASLSGGTTICEGDTTQIVFNAAGGLPPYDIEIDNGLGQFGNISDGTSFDVNPLNNTTYSLLEVLDANGCGTSNFTSSASVNVLAGPDADFSTSINKSIVSFTDQSTGAVSWFWDFGDSTTSTQQNPVHVYNFIGIKNVVLTSTNADGCTDDVSKNVLILEVSGLNALENGENINIYPNPAENSLNIELKLNKSSVLHTDIVSIDGKVLKSREEKLADKDFNFGIDISDLSQGMYILRFKLEDGRNLNTRFYKN